MPTLIRMRRFVLVGPASLILLAGCRETTGPADSQPGSTLAAATVALTFRQVSANNQYSCGVTVNDLAYCWGANYEGRFGNGTTQSTARPVPVGGNLRFRHVDTGWLHACGVTTGGRAYCWGSNDQGQLGDGTRVDRSRPVAVAGGLSFRRVSAGQYHTCGVTTNDRAYCWGYNLYGQVGDGPPITRHKQPVLVNGGRRYRSVTAGALHSCGLTTAGSAFCWGSGTNGELGNNSTLTKRTPQAVAGGLTFREAFAGETGHHACAVTTDNRAYCWGYNVWGQLGDGTTTTRLKPTAVAGGIQFAQVRPGEGHSCGVSTANVAYCWGKNYYGALGDGGPLGDLAQVHETPFAVSGGLSFASVNAGGEHTCGVTPSGQAYCWGQDTAGQLGDGTPSQPSSSPGPVLGPS